jgi:hypothetical protein
MTGCSFNLPVVFSALSLPAMLSTASLSSCPPGIPDTFTDEVPLDFRLPLSFDRFWFQLAGEGFYPFPYPQFNFFRNRSPLLFPAAGLNF